MTAHRIAFIFGIIALYGSAADVTHSEVSGARFFSRTVLIDDEEFSIDRLLVRAQAFKTGVSGRYSFAQLTLARNSAEYARATGKPGTDIDYQWWRDEYAREYQHPFPIARVTVIRDGCVLQFRNNAGRTQRAGCGEKDPLLITTRRGYEILTVAGGYLDINSRPLYADPFEITASIKSFDESPDTAIELWIKLSKLFGTRALTIHVRPDLWFIDTVAFPVLFPFSVGAPPQAPIGLGGWLSICTGELKKVHCVIAQQGIRRDYDFSGKMIRQLKAKP